MRMAFAYKYFHYIYVQHYITNEHAYYETNVNVEVDLAIKKNGGFSKWTISRKHQAKSPLTKEYFLLLSMCVKDLILNSDKPSLFFIVTKLSSVCLLGANKIHFIVYFLFSFIYLIFASALENK